ncbi:MAG: GTPase HflX [Candidatus Hydrothermota bacterium]|nr:MAG: GTPase HflX [Candidatus Hydrothermae bacterium]
MKKLIDLTQESRKERALIVGLALSSQERWHEIDRLEELAQLTETAGAEVFEKIIQIRDKIDPSFYIGRGKAQEIARIVQDFGIDLVVFDCELSPSQTRNLEKLLKCKVLDRTEIIMDIFAQHAKTAEAKIQVELAQLRYRLSKLVGRGRELSRLGGGIGTRGPGEKKLEEDRFHISRRIRHLERELEKIERTKEIQRKRRKEILKVSLVGYTNTGKSSIMNRLTKADVLVEDKLFATLDATTRIFYIEDMPKPVVLSDTVGFIEDLPPSLVASFRATLGVVREADLLLHVIDITSSRLSGRIEIVEKTLEEIGCGDKPLIRVFNKIDLLLDRTAIERLSSEYSDAVFVSARSGEGIEELKEVIKNRLLEIFKGLKSKSLSSSKGMFKVAEG